MEHTRTWQLRALFIAYIKDTLAECMCVHTPRTDTPPHTCTHLYPHHTHTRTHTHARGAPPPSLPSIFTYSCTRTATHTHTCTCTLDTTIPPLRMCSHWLRSLRR